MTRARTALAALFFAASAPGAAELRYADVLRAAADRSGDAMLALEERGALLEEFRASRGAFDWTWKTATVANAFGYYESFAVDTWVEKPLGPWSSSVFTGYRWSGGDFAPYDGKYETAREGEARAGLRFSLLRNRDVDRRRTTLEAAELSERAGDAAFRQASFAVMREAARKYWDLALAQQRLKIAENLLRAGEERQSFLEQRHQHGDIPRFDVDDNRRSILQRRTQVIQARRQTQAEANRLAVLLRGPVDPDRAAEIGWLNSDARELPAPVGGAESWMDLARRRRPEYARLAAQARQQEIEARLQDNAALPRLDMQAAASRDFGPADVPLSESNLETQLWLEIPLQRREARGKAAAARARLRRTEMQRDVLERQIEAEVRDLDQSFAALRERAALAREERDLARTLEEGERRRYTHGESNLIFLNLREQNLFDASIRYSETFAEFRKLEADLFAAIAAPFEDWIRP